MYKIISKVLCNRLKACLPTLVDQAQSAFIEGRAIQDNVLIAFEAIHSMKRKTRGKVGEMALKIDISKAYDRVDWRFLTAILEQMGFCEKWVKWMKMCVCTVEYSILLERDVVGPIQPGRGLRQGDPLSPYLFILCAEGLSAMISYEIARGSLHGLRMGRQGPPISHLMFADDSMFFCRATATECTNLKNTLSTYEKLSGQAINFQKFDIFFSRNVSDSDRERISDLLGVHQPLNTGRYLGLPSLIGRNKKAIFGFLRDRLWSRLQSWQGKKLSKAGKEVLIKSVAQSIPAFCMTTFLLPISLTEELERMINSFWWGSGSDHTKGIKWMRWERLGARKDVGGLGFRNFHLFNLAMLGKIGWRLIDNPNTLVCKVLKAKYFSDGDFLSAELGHNPSYTWRGIWSSQNLLRNGIRWKIGDGATVRVYQDPWLREDKAFYVNSFHEPDLHHVRVKDLMIANGNSWDVNLISTLFEDRVANQILSIPISATAGCDRRIWHYDRKGIYSVSSAYKIARMLTIDENLTGHGGWKTLWQLDVPPKVKFFLWRAAQNCLPTKANLLAKGVEVGGECGVCGSGYENSWHSFVACSFAEACWAASPFLNQVQEIRDRSESFVEFLFHLLDLKKEDTNAKTAMILWQIWRDRNGAVWNNKMPLAQTSISMAARARDEWRSESRPHRAGRNNSGRRSPCNGWHDLDNGWFMCKVDAAFFSATNTTGIGIILQGAHGEFIAAKVITLPGCMRVDEGEAMGMLEALSWIKQRGIGRVKVRTDSKLVADGISSSGSDCSEFGSIIDRCRQLLSYSVSFDIKHISRGANLVAHKLASISKDFPSTYVWDEPPTFVEDLLVAPCVCR